MAAQSAITVRLTPAALSDIGEIYASIAAVNPAAAQRVEDRIRRTVERFGYFPKIGAPTDFVNVRRFPMPRYPYTIFYRLSREGDAIDVLRIIHSARIKDLKALPR